MLCFSQVRQAAFQSLGQFISTFASPSSNVGQYFKEGGEEGEWTTEHPQKNRYLVCSCTVPRKRITTCVFMCFCPVQSVKDDFDLTFCCQSLIVMKNSIGQYEMYIL